MNVAQQSTINPAFARHHSDKLREVTGELHRVYDNLREIARGDTPNSTSYDRLRALRILYDRGFGKVTRNQAHNSGPGSSRPSESEESQNHTNHSSDIPEPKTAAAERPVVRLEQKLNDELGPPQAPADPDQTVGEGFKPADPDQIVEAGFKPACPEPAEGSKGGIPAPSPNAPGYFPDLVRESQYYIMEITNYGDELASILMSIHEPDPEDDSIRDCHRITAGMMIIERVLGPAAELAHPLDHSQDPTEDPNWMTRHPAEIDAEVTPEELMEADRATRELLDDYRKQREDCADCTDEDPCDEHYMDEDDMLMNARVFRNMRIYGDRIYFDLERGGVKLHPRNYIDDS